MLDECKLNLIVQQLLENAADGILFAYSGKRRDLYMLSTIMNSSDVVEERTDEGLAVGIRVDIAKKEPVKYEKFIKRVAEKYTGTFGIKHICEKDYNDYKSFVKKCFKEKLLAIVDNDLICGVIATNKNVTSEETVEIGRYWMEHDMVNGLSLYDGIPFWAVTKDCLWNDAVFNDFLDKYFEQSELFGYSFVVGGK